MQGGITTPGQNSAGRLLIEMQRSNFCLRERERCPFEDNYNEN